MRRILQVVCGPTFVLAGILHLVRPSTYEAIMPPWLPAHRALVLASGVAESAGGAGLLAPDPRMRRAAGWWLAATLVGVFPANVHMALHPDDVPRVPGGRPALLARLPLQVALIAWVLDASRRA